MDIDRVANQPEKNWEVSGKYVKSHYGLTYSLYFRKLVGKYADLDFITAPHLIPSDNPDEQVNNY